MIGRIKIGENSGRNVRKKKSYVWENRDPETRERSGYGLYQKLIYRYYLMKEEGINDHMESPAFLRIFLKKVRRWNL